MHDVVLHHHQNETPHGRYGRTASTRERCASCVKVHACKSNLSGLKPDPNTGMATVFAFRCRTKGEHEMVTGVTASARELEAELSSRYPFVS